MQKPALVAAPARGTALRPHASVVEKVAQAMARHYVAGLPRNYELFYEALCGQNPELRREIETLPALPSQTHLDELGLKHRLVGHCGIAAERIHNDTTGTLRDLNEHLSLGLSHKRAMIRALETAASTLDRPNMSLSEALSEIEYLTSSVSALLLSETELSRALEDGAGKLETLDRGAGAIGAAILRDRLTGLANRIAFTNQLSALYDGDHDTSRTAVITVDIDDFKQINEKYGQAAGNKLLKRLSSIFKTSIKKDDFLARIGGDEFAFIFHDVTPDAALRIAERLRNSVEEKLVFASADARDPGCLTISAGIALGDGAATPATLLAQAETALAAARANRRRPVVMHSLDVSGNPRPA